MIELPMAYNYLVHIYHLVSGGLDSSIQLVMWLALDTSEYVRDLRSPDCRIVLPTASLPKYHASDRMVDEDAVHGKLAALVHERGIFGGPKRCIAASYDEALVCFGSADFEYPELDSIGTDVRDVIRHGATFKLGLDGSHCC